MSLNLVSLLAQYLTPEVIGRIASTLGVDRSLAGKALVALAPTLLRTLTGIAATPLGAQRVAGAVEKQDPGILSSLESVIGGSGHDSIIQNGIGALESLAGGSAVSALAGALGKFSGLGESAASSLIGLATPAVLGVLSKEKAAQGLDASGLAKLLDSQKENVSAAIPSELNQLLRAANLPGFSTGPSVSQPEITRPAAPVGTRPVPVEPAPSRGFDWRLPLAAVAALALASYYFLGDRTHVAETPKPVTTTTIEPQRTGPVTTAIQNLTVDGVNLNTSVKTAFDNLRTTLQGVTDTASAQNALPYLQKGAAELDRLRDLASKLPVDSRSSFALLISQFRPSIEELFDKVLQIPGVSAVARPVIDGLRTRLNTLSA